MNEREELELFRHLMHRIQMHYAITLNSEEVKNMLKLIDSWSYAHRVGNGQLTEEEQQEKVDKALQNIEEYLNGG